MPKGHRRPKKPTWGEHNLIGKLVKSEPAVFYDLNGDWRPGAMAKLSAAADALLGAGRQSKEGSEGHVPVNEILNDDFSDFGAWDGSANHYARRRRPASKKFREAGGHAKWRGSASAASKDGGQPQAAKLAP